MSRRLSSVVALCAAVVLLSSTSAHAAPGDLDASFGSGGVALVSDGATDRVFFDVSLDATGRVVAAGMTGDLEGRETDILVARFDADGDPDPSFGSAGVAVVELDGFEVAARLGTLPDGSVVVGGLRLTLEDFGVSAFLAKLTSTGMLDTTFGDGGTISLGGGDPREEGSSFVAFAGLAVDEMITLQTVEIDFASDEPSGFEPTLRRFTAAGAPDSSFGGDGSVEVDPPGTFFPADLVLADDGYAIAGGDERGPAVVRVDRAGALVASFGSAGLATVPVDAVGADPNAVIVDPESGALAIGAQNAAGEVIVARLTADGDVVDDFGIGGVRTFRGSGRPGGGMLLAVEPTGEPIIATIDPALDDADASMSIHRLQANGPLDASFGTDGRVSLATVGSFQGLQIVRGAADDRRLLLAGGGLRPGQTRTTAAVAALEIGGGTEAPPRATVERVAAADRVATAIALSQDHFPTDGDRAPGAVIAAADRFPDALVAIPLAASRGVPLLLTPGADLDRRVVDELRRVVGTSASITLVGGTGALAEEVENDVRGLGYRVRRIAGADRFGTARAVAEETNDVANVVVLATGRTFPDALAGGAAAAHAGGVVLLTDGTDLPFATARYLEERGDAHLYAVGGDAATAVPDADPIVGADRYETAALVAERFFTTPPMVGVATGEGFADALSGGTHAALSGGPLLLSPSGVLGADPTAYLASRADFLTRVVLYGGTAALAAAVESGARRAVD